MATVVRKCWRILLFSALFLFSLRFIHPYPIVFTRRQTDWLITLSDRLGFRDPEMCYLTGVLLINTLITCTLYFIVTCAWKRWRQRKTTNG